MTHDTICRSPGWRERDRRRKKSRSERVATAKHTATRQSWRRAFAGEGGIRADSGSAPRDVVRVLALNTEACARERERLSSGRS